MPDHRIGITLDVKQNQGLNHLQQDASNVNKSFENMQRQFKNLDSVNGSLLNKGWGSRQQTDELQKQLRMMQQIATLSERQAQRAGNVDAQKQIHDLQGKIRSAQQDVEAVRNNSRPTVGDMARSTARWGAASLAAYGGYKGLNLLYNGYNANLQMLPTFANMGQTMAPNGGNMAWAQSMLRAGQGFGYDNASILAGAQTIQAAAGKSNNFFGQIRGVAQFGRYNGFDYGQAANYFANAYQSGVVGGNQAQMSWQQYAILVANTVNAGNMQGRNGQVVNALQQLTQMAQTSTVNAPNQNSIASAYATVGKTGNQAWINQFPNQAAAVNANIINPGGGPYAQAAMMQAVDAGARLNYVQSIELQNKGLFGINPANKKTTLENVMTSFYRKGGNSSDLQKYWMSEGLYGDNKHTEQAAEWINTFFKNGRFNESALTPENKAKILKAMQDSGMSSPLSQILNNTVAPGQSAQNTTSHAAGPGAWLYNATLGNPVGQIATAVYGPKLIKQGISKARGFFKGAPRGTLTPPVTSEAAEGASSIIYGPNGEILSRVPTLAEAGAGAAEAGAAGAADAGAGLLGSLGLAGGLEGAGLAADSTGVGLPVGIALGLAGLIPLLLGSGGSSSKSKASVADKRQGVTYADFNANKAATETAAILMALRPWAKQIDQWYSGAGGSTSMKNTNTTFTPQSNSGSNSITDNSVGNEPISGGNWLSNMLGGSNSTLGQWIAKLTGDPYSGEKTTSTISASGESDFVKKMLPYAQKVSGATGLPLDFLLSQWGDESGWGSSQLAKNYNNFGGIKVPGTNQYESYSSPNAWAQGDIDFYTKNSNYNKLLSDARSGASTDTLLSDLQASGYSESSSYGSAIKSIVPSVDSILGSAKKSGSILGNSYPNSNGQVSVNVNAPKTISVQLQQNNQNVGNAMIPLTTQATYNGQA